MPRKVTELGGSTVDVWYGSGAPKPPKTTSPSRVWDADDTDVVVTASANDVAAIEDDNGQQAAVVSGSNPSITTYSPPTESLDHIYYNSSYRYRLKTPSGYVGIRG